MAFEFKHKDVGPSLSKTEWEGIDTHEADGETANDMLYFNGTSWIRATPAQVSALFEALGIERSEILLTPKASSTGAQGTLFYNSGDDHVYVCV